MSWFSTLKQSLLPQSQQQETERLEETVIEDREIIESAPMAATPLGVPATHTSDSALSPFASRILEKAKIESLKSDEERKKITSPAELFLTNKEAIHRVDHIQSLALERTKKATNSFVDAAKASANPILNAFAKRAGNK